MARLEGSGVQSQPKWGWVSAKCPHHAPEPRGGGGAGSGCPWKLRKSSARTFLRGSLSPPRRRPPVLDPSILLINLCHFLQE